MSSEEAEALATTPLGHIARAHLVESPPSSLLAEEMPFDLSNHPTAKHRVAISMLSRLDREVKLCAQMRNARQKPALTSLQTAKVKAIADGDMSALEEARKQMNKLREELLALKAKDEEFVAMAIDKSFGDANNIDLSLESGSPLRDRLRFWLLRYADLEATLWFEHLCCGLLSPQAERDFTQLNPFLSADAAAGLLSRLTQMMLVAGRIIQTCRALDSCQDLADLLANPEAAGSSLALAAGLGEKANVLCGLLASKRTYVQKAASADGGFKGIFDPHYLVFEFVTGFLLRPRQVEMVNEFSDALRSGKSSVKQMIMGAGKTSVVSPLLALMHANGSRIVCLVVPPALISLSRSVLQNCFSTVVQKRVSTFKCDRSLDLEVALSERLGRIVSHGDILLTTPGDVKSLELRFLEQLDLANDRQARRNTTQMRRECVQMGRALQLMKEGVCMIDEVDLVLHPLRSELNFPIGPKNLIEHAPERWRAVLHLLDGFFSVEKGRVPPHLKDSLRAKEILQTLGEIIRSGCERRYLQCNPHLILLSEEFYHKEVKPIMCDWLMLWLSSEHVGRAFEQPSGDREDRGLSEDEVRAYLLHRVTPQRLELEASLEVWQGCLARAGGGSTMARTSSAWILDVLNGAVGTKAGPGRLELPRPETGGGGFEPVARSSYLATRLEPLEKGNVRLLLEETQAGADVRGQRVERLPAKDAKSMNLSWDWLQVFLPFSLQKIDRVTFGIMSSEQVSAALAEQPLMPLTRAKLAIPFVGKDVPSQSSEFAHPDVVIGLTILAYRYEGLRREDFDEVLGMLCDRLESEAGAVLERPTSLLWRTWVEESGADFCVKQAELDEQTSSQVLGLEEGGALQKPDRMRPRVLPLHLLERRNEANMAQLFELVRKLPSAVHFYLEQSVFPQFMRFQDEKLSASGQDLGGSILFGQRIGFSGTPSDLMPRELGQCDYEPGSEGEMVSTMTDTQVVTFEAVQPGWNVELLLDSIIEAAHQNRCNALIDTGALITGLTNQEVAEYLLGFGRARAEAADSPSARSAPTLPDFMDGVVFLDDDGGKKILLRQTREITKLADSGVPAQKRFAFYDQVHTTGMDIQHKLDAVAALTLGKDMCWRDYVQGAYRMRGIGRGQRICLYVIPEVVELISRDLILAGIEQKLQGPAGAKWTACEKGRLLAVAAWLLVNSIRTERIQFAMLQLQNLANVWRRNAFKTVMTDFEVVTSEGLKEAVQIFKEPIAFTLPSGVPKPRGVHEVVQDRVEQMATLIAGEEDEQAVAEVKNNVQELSKLADEKEGEAGLETEQQREQEQERQQEQEQEEEKEQEIEIEKFVDLMHCRDDEEPESWPLASLAAEEKAKQFYEAQRFKLWKRRPLDNLPPEARISTNWFNPQWSGFRRVKNVFVQMEWVPDLAKALRSKEPLLLDPVEEMEMHKKLRTAWDLLMRGEGIEMPSPEVTITRSETQVVPGKKVEKLPPPPGEIGAERLMELLAASFDWDPALRDPAAALAFLGRKRDEKLSYEDMVQLLLDGRFRTRDEHRHFVMLSLAEAETLRRVLHARLQENQPLLKQAAPGAAVALRCVFANHAVLDASQGFQPGPTFQCRMLHQLARFLDGQSFFRPPEISVLLRALQRNRPFDRRRFFEGLGGCRRRGGSAGGWEQQPVAEVLRPWLEFEQILARVRAVRLHAAIYGQGLSVQMAFQRYDVNQSGLLEPMELCRALRELGFAFDAFEVANWIEAVDTTGNHCADYAEFLAFCKLQVDALLGTGHVPKAALAADATPLVVDRRPSLPKEEQPAPQESANPATEAPPGLPELHRHTSEIVRPDEIEEELLERRAEQKRQDAEEARAKAEVEEAIEVLVEEELGMNPAYGEGYGEWDFRGQLLPKDTYALGVVDLIPESWGTKGGKNFLLFDARAGLAVQRIQLAPNGNSDRRINKYSLTIWFRISMLPSKADRILLLDLPRGDMDSELVDETPTGGSGSSVFIWRGGILAPEGYHEPSLQKKDLDSSSALRQMVNGEWHLRFRSKEHDKKVEMLLTMEPSGRLLLSPSRGAASRKKADTSRTSFGVRLKLHQEVQEYIELHHDGVAPEDFGRVLESLWQKIRNSCTIAMEGRSWAEIGWPGSQNQVKRRALKDLQSRRDVLIARGLPALDALRIARGLKGYSQAGADFVEDKSLEKELKIGDMVQCTQESETIGFGLFGGVNVLEPGEAGKVANLNHNRGQVLVEGKKGSRWYGDSEVVKVDPKALGLVPLTDSEWAGLPSTRANYVAFSQQLPNPLLEGGWMGKGRAEKSTETSSAEVDLNFDVVAMGFMSSYVDAQVFYAEAGMEIKGQWRAADGSTGEVTGIKALAGLALGGLWHVELQSGADSMQHAWNCWFSCFPPSSSSNVTSIRISGSALAGPMLQEGMAPENAPPALRISGEMTGKGVVSFTMTAEEGDLKALESLGAMGWVNSTWEGELGTDRWLRGAWRRPDAGGAGRWRARHIGRAAVHGTMKPQVDSGAEWEPKRCEIRTAPADTKPGRLKKGMKVKLSKIYKTCSDAGSGPLKEGQVGVIIQENPGQDQPVNVKAPSGGTWWFQEKALVPAFALHDDSRLFNPLGDDFEGVSFTRFPVTQGNAYAEVRVVRIGRTQPVLGFAVMEEEEGKTIFTRLAVIEGRTSRKLDVSGRPEKPPELQRKSSKPEAAAKKAESKEEIGAGDDEDEEEEEQEEEPTPEKNEEKKRKGWDLAKSYGDRWEEGDVICCQVMMPSGIIAFGLNGDFQAPMGTAFDLKLPAGAKLCLVASAGENGRLRVNLGQVAFSFPPPSQLEALIPEIEDEEEEQGEEGKEGKEGEEGEGAEVIDDAAKEVKEEPAAPAHLTVEASMGLGEAMSIRPLWQVKLPKAVKAWPVYALPSRDSQGRKAMKDGEVVEQIKLQSDGGWVQHQAGWSPCKMVVVGNEYEALKPTPAWVGIDKPPKEKKLRKTIKRVVHATFDTELCSQHCWNFRGSDEAQCSNGPNMLVSTESAAAGILRWCIKGESGNKALEVGVIPADKVEEANFLFEQSDCGVKSSGTKGGNDKTVFDIYMKYVDVIADLDARQLKVMVGDTREQMVEVKSCDIPFEDDVKLAITGWNNTKLRLEPPARDKLGDSDESDAEDYDTDGLVVTSCGNAVQASTWHVATMVVDLPASTCQIYLDGELHLNVRDPGGLVSDGRLSVDPREGMMIFSAAKRGGSGLGSADWRAGGHLRAMRLDTSPLSQFDVWSQQLPKGIWICRCTARNAADARICWRCRNTRTRSGARPPGDADPRVEGLTVITADSFRELVLESQKHVLVVASASWCPPCQQLKPRIHRLAQLLAAEPSIAVAVIDTDENELQSRYFPEPHIPNVKLFLQGQKRQPVAVTDASGMSLDELAGFIEQQTGVSIQKAIEKGFPAYAERVGVAPLLEKLKRCAMTKLIGRSAGQPALKALAAFLYNELITGCQEAREAPKLPGPPMLQRAISAKSTQKPAAGPPVLSRAVSGGARQRLGYSPVLAMGSADPRLTERLLDELFEKQLLGVVRVAQPEELTPFVRAFLLKAAGPAYNHTTFFNAILRISWQVAPLAEKLVAATRILRAIMRWASQRRALVGLPPLMAPWAPPPEATEMSAAAQRHSWRRIEIALANEEHRHGLSELGLLLDRGLPPDTAPFGITPLLLAAAIGHLPAAQFLFVRGASPHVAGGQPPLLPVEAAARHNHLRIVELLLENGAVAGRALHFAAAGGSTDVANYLLSKGCSADAAVQGLSPVAAALISRQHAMALLLLPHCNPEALAAPLSDEGCAAAGLATGSTLAHLAASVGGLCETFVLGLLRSLPPAACFADNSRGQSALDLMPTTLRIAVKPQLYSALAAAVLDKDPAARVEVVSQVLQAGRADPRAMDTRGFSLLDLAAYTGSAPLVDLLAAHASTGKLSALMWAHWGGQDEVVLKLTSKGASLSNADLEGLQLLRSARASLSDESDKSRGVRLLEPDASQLWRGCWPPYLPQQLSPSTNTYLCAAQPLMQRMTWGTGKDNGVAMPGATAAEEEEKKTEATQAEELLEAIKLTGAKAEAVASAQLLALRLTAEGQVGLSPANIIALNLFLMDTSFHSEVNTAMAAQFSQSPAPSVRERAADIQAAHAELADALEALPARKVVCFRAVRLALPGGLRELLRGHRLGMDCYRPGSIVMWRHATSCTQDPALAEELALHGEPAGGCGVVFKIRRTASARPVADFSATPEQQEVVFAPGTIFRVVGFYPCTQHCLRKGTLSDGPWAAELGSAAAASAARSEALAWEEVSRARSAMVLMDEEDAGSVQRTDLPL